VKEGAILYKRSLGRAVKGLAFPLVLVIALSIIFIQALNNQNFTKAALLFFVILIFFIPNLCLFLNHWRFSNGTCISFGDKLLTIIQRGRVVEVPSNADIKFEEFRTYREGLIGPLKYWQIQVKGETFLISNIIISKAKFDRYFWNRIEERRVLWPLMKYSR
jgi:hypothetical protein